MDRARRLALVEAAIRAPSSHNTQPWSFVVRQDGVDLRADRTRVLDETDPDQRELTISCGAALFNLRAAADADALRADACPLPDATDPDLIARVQLQQASAPGPLAGLAAAIASRQTTRAEFTNAALPEGLQAALQAAAQAEGAALHWVGTDLRMQVAELVREGNISQFANKRWRAELASWMRSHGDTEGLPFAGLFLPFARAAVKRFNLGPRIADLDHPLVLLAPTMAVLSTEHDTAADWLKAGQALERMLLVATAQGVQAGYLNQPCQLPELRTRLAALCCPGAHPQMLIRFGIPREAPLPHRRRPLTEVITERA